MCVCTLCTLCPGCKGMCGTPTFHHAASYGRVTACRRVCLLRTAAWLVDCKGGKKRFQSGATWRGLVLSILVVQYCPMQAPPDSVGSGACGRACESCKESIWAPGSWGNLAAIPQSCLAGCDPLFMWENTFPLSQHMLQHAVCRPSGPKM